MASKAQQRSKAKKDKRKAQERLQRALVPWIGEIISNYRIGDTIADREAAIDLNQILRKFYNTTSKDVLTFDIREFKQNEQDEPDNFLFGVIAVQLGIEFLRRLPNSVRSITNTSNKWVVRTTQLAIENEWTTVEAKRALTNYLKGQRLTIAVTESQWTVETTRKVAVLSIEDPLKNSLERMIQFIEAGDFNAANRFARRLEKLTKLPSSVNQGLLIRRLTTVPSESRFINTLTQAEAITNLRRQGEKLKSKGKQWETIGDGKVRVSHQIARGQIQPIEEPFVLEGGLLQYPGDGSLGADLGEIINCRCISVYL